MGSEVGIGGLVVLGPLAAEVLFDAFVLSFLFSPTNFGAGFPDILGHALIDVTHAVGIGMPVVFLIDPELKARYPS